MTPSFGKTILDWVRTTIVAGSTEYRRYQAQALRARFSLRFPDLGPASRVRSGRPGDLDAPTQLSADVAALVRFKTATLTAIGERRTGVWGEETAEQKVEHLGLLFGALAAEPDGPVAGAGVPRERLTLAMLVVPAVWDWYLSWREAKRGFFTSWEADMLELAKALTRRETGWLRQNRGIGSHLQAIAGLLDEADVSRIQSDWNQACDDLHNHACARAVEVRRVARVHRDPFEPILPILEADCPLAEYRRIATEVISRIPDRDRYPLAAAESVRGFLMLRLGLHLGVRQKNLRQLLFRPKGKAPTAERQLERMRRGELRWSERDQGWEVLIPAVAFKNASSSFFGSKPFRLVLPDLDGLYPILDEYRSAVATPMRAVAAASLRSAARTSGRLASSVAPSPTGIGWAIEGSSFINLTLSTAPGTNRTSTSRGQVSKVVSGLMDTPVSVTTAPAISRRYGSCP